MAQSTDLTLPMWSQSLESLLGSMSSLLLWSGIGSVIVSVGFPSVVTLVHLFHVASVTRPMNSARRRNSAKVSRIFFPFLFCPILFSSIDS